MEALLTVHYHRGIDSILDLTGKLLDDSTVFGRHDRESRDGFGNGLVADSRGRFPPLALTPVVLPRALLTSSAVMEPTVLVRCA